MNETRENQGQNSNLQTPLLSSSNRVAIADLRRMMEDFMSEARTLQYQRLDYMEEIHEDLMQEVDDIQHSPSLLSSAYTTHEEGIFHLTSKQFGIHI